MNTVAEHFTHTLAGSPPQTVILTDYSLKSDQCTGGPTGLPPEISDRPLDLKRENTESWIIVPIMTNYSWYYKCFSELLSCLLNNTLIGSLMTCLDS